jgi:hypothetical protein
MELPKALASRYCQIWDEIKTTGCATITVSKAAACTVEQGVKRVKTAENVARRLAGLVGWSKLVVRRESISGTHMKITFTLLYRTDL